MHGNMKLLWTMQLDIIVEFSKHKVSSQTKSLI